MKESGFALLGLTLMVLCGLGPASAATVIVDSGERLGRPPELLASNVWIVAKNDLRHRYYIEKFFAEQRPKVVQYTLSFDIFMQDTRNLEDYLKRLERVLLKEDGAPRLVMEGVKAADARLVVGFEPYSMPPWLSARRGDDRRAYVNEEWWTIERVSPPGDYVLAGRVVKETLRFLKDRIGVKKLGFYVGHEPETQWLGDEGSLFRYYEHAARAAKEVDPNIQVGGLGFYAIASRKVGCDDSHFTPATQDLCRKEGGWSDPRSVLMMRSFVNYCIQHKVPLDFINWHSFGIVPPDRYQGDATAIKGWLREGGLDRVVLYPSDWTYWAGPYPTDYLDTEEAAAYVVSALYSMWKAGIAWHGHDLNIEVAGFEAKRARERQDAEFIGDWPLLTRHGVVKPVYNAFRAVTLLTAGSAEQIAASVSGAPDLGVFATVKDDGVYVLMSNYMPGKEKAAQYALFRYFGRMGLSSEDVWLVLACRKISETKQEEQAARCRKLIDERLTTPKERQAIAFVRKARQCVGDRNGKREGGVACIRALAESSGSPDIARATDEALRPLAKRPVALAVQLEVERLPFAVAGNAKAFWIDRAHANACRANKATESRSTDTACGIGGRVDKAIAPLVHQAKREMNDPAKRGLLQSRKGEMYEKFRTVIDRINAHQGVDLIASQVSVPVRSESGRARIDVSMEPNSVVLFVLPRR